MVSSHHSSMGEVWGSQTAGRRELRVIVPGTMGHTHSYPVSAKFFLFVILEGPEEGPECPVILLPAFCFAFAKAPVTSIFPSLKDLYPFVLHNIE